MKKRLRLLIFLLVALIQISVPVYMIAKREITLHNGRQFKFKTAPVDPYDAFRGRYVNVRIEAERIFVPKDTELFGGQKVYALLDKDSEGFAEIKDISIQPPKTGEYLATKIEYMEERADNNYTTVHIRIPFDRYYMEESLAPAAENAYRDNPQNAYITVRVLSGFAVAEQLYIDGQPIEEYLKNR